MLNAESAFVENNVNCEHDKRAVDTTGFGYWLPAFPNAKVSLIGDRPSASSVSRTGENLEKPSTAGDGLVDGGVGVRGGKGIGRFEAMFLGEEQRLLQPNSGKEMQQVLLSGDHDTGYLAIILDMPF